MQAWAKKSSKILLGVIAAAVLLSPGYLNALGFGNIKVKSALNEPLDAEIELLSANDDDIKDLEVKLASREAFLRAGVDRSNQLTQIKFNIVKHSGKYIISLKTGQPVREPFLNFLLEMNWKNGRMLREYTVLLDPPDRRASQVAETPEPAPPTVTAPEPVAIAPAAAPEPVVTALPPATTEVAKTEPAQPATPASAPEPVVVKPEPEAAPAASAPEPVVAAEPVKPEPKAGKKAKKGNKKGKKATTSTDENKPAETPTTPAEPAKAVETTPEPAAAAPANGGTETAQTQPDLFPRLPLNSNNEVDTKALEDSIKQSQATHKDEVVSTEPTQPTTPTPTPAVESAPTASAPAPSEAPVESKTPEPTATPPEPSTPEPKSVSSTAPAGSLDYGITRKGDNLWSIATKLKPSDEVTIYQVMMALQQSNPEAFVKGNVHRLKPNQVMRIEDPRLLTAMTKEQAIKRYEEQTSEWKEFLTRVGAQIPRQAIVAGDTGTKSATATTPAGELTLTPPNGEGEGVGSGQSDKLAKKQNTEQLRKQVQKAVAEVDTERRKNSELASRVEDLEKELKRLENLVTVKDSDLANLQHKLDEVQKQRAALSKAAPEKPAVIETETAKNEVKPEVKPEVKAEPVATPTPVIEQAKPAEPPVTPAQSQPAPTEVAPVTTVPPVMAPQPPAVEPATAHTGVEAVKPQKDTGILAIIKSTLAGIGLYLIIGGVVIVAVLVLLFLWIRGRNKVHFQESILKGGTGADSQLNSSLTSAPVSTQSSLMTGGESSFLSDFAISGVSAIQAEDSEVDPLTEADVFMAYGRYEAAEERLNEAIKHDPKRGELRVKILELFATTKNKKAFENAAEDFYATLGNQAAGNPLWQKVVSMGSDIAPHNPLFKGAVGGGGAAMNFTNTSNLNDSKVMDIGLDTGAFSKSDFAAAVTSKPAGPPYSDGLDFNLNAEDRTRIPPAKSAVGASTEDSSLEFNLDFGNASASPASKPSGVTQDMDFNLDLAKDEEPTATDLKFANADNNDELDFDLESPGPGGGNRPTLEMNLDAADSINLDMPAGGDEVGTKLDLARAYIDMGDPDGARSILDEVMAEGSEGQKQEARQLISQIG
ncbi:MAG: hypothetical protein HY080_03455 [Gammaproteobacteria bacterium]|nr:hypothetical protein [Gammaproteobacteria bacterium]